MAKVNKRLSELQEEITKLKNYSEELRKNEPDAYQKEFSEIQKKLQGLYIEHFTHLINVYKGQNLGKFKAKEEALNAKLEYLKQGGDIKLWSYPNWLKLQSIQAMQATAEKTKEPKPNQPSTGTKSESEAHKCDKCEFVAKNANGLRLHSAKHK